MVQPLSPVDSLIPTPVVAWTSSHLLTPAERCDGAKPCPCLVTLNQKPHMGWPDVILYWPLGHSLAFGALPVAPSSAALLGTFLSLSVLFRLVLSGGLCGWALRSTHYHPVGFYAGARSLGCGLGGLEGVVGGVRADTYPLHVCNILGAGVVGGALSPSATAPSHCHWPF